MQTVKLDPVTRKEIVEDLVKEKPASKEVKNDSERVLKNYLFTLPSTEVLLPISKAARMLRKLSSTSVLDPCGGYGSILLAALATKIPRITVVNSYKPLNYCYQQMADDFPTTEYTLFSNSFVNSTFQTEFAEAGGFYDTVFTSITRDRKLTKENDTETERAWKVNFLFPMMLLSWRYLEVYGTLCLHFSTDDYKEEVSTIMRSLENAAPGPTTKIGRDEFRTWKKTFDTSSSTGEGMGKLITVKNAVYTLSYDDLLNTVLQAYFNVLPDNIHYIARGYDPLALTLARNAKKFKDRTFKFYVHKTNLNLADRIDVILPPLKKRQPNTVIYNEDYQEVKEILSKSVDDANVSKLNDHLIEEFDENLTLEVLMTDTLYQYLGENTIVEPRKVWIRGNFVLLQSLLKLWEHTHFYYITLYSIDDTVVMRNLISSGLHRVTIIKSNLAMREVVRVYGTPTDSIMEYDVEPTQNSVKTTKQGRR